MKLADEVQEDGTVESRPKQDGRNMTMVLAPTRTKAQALADARKRKESEALDASEDADD
jgi:translation initiation factor IF-3